MSHNFRRVLPPDLTRVKRRRGRRGGRPGLRDMVRVVLHALICIGSASHEHCCARVSGCDSVSLTRGDHRRTRTSTSRACAHGKDAARGRAPLPTTRSDGRPTSRALAGVEYGIRPDCPKKRRLWEAAWEQRGRRDGVSQLSCTPVIYILNHWRKC